MPEATRTSWGELTSEVERLEITLDARAVRLPLLGQCEPLAEPVVGLVDGPARGKVRNSTLMPPGSVMYME